VFRAAQSAPAPTPYAPPPPQWLTQPRAQPPPPPLQQQQQPRRAPPPYRPPPQQQQQQQQPYGNGGGGYGNGGRGGRSNFGGGRGGGHGRGGAAFEPQRPFVPHFPVGGDSRCWFAAWLPDGRMLHVPKAGALAALPPPPPPPPPPPEPEPEPAPEAAASAPEAAGSVLLDAAEEPAAASDCDGIASLAPAAASSVALEPPMPLAAAAAAAAASSIPDDADYWDAEAQRAWEGASVPCEMHEPPPPPPPPPGADADVDFSHLLVSDSTQHDDDACIARALAEAEAEAEAEAVAASSSSGSGNGGGIGIGGGGDASVYAPAQFIRDLFPELPLDVETIVAAMGVDEALRICFDLMASDASASDGGAEGSWSYSGDGEDMAAHAEGDAKLATLQDNFPAMPLEALLSVLELHGGELDAATAELYHQEQAAAAVEAASAAAAAPEDGAPRGEEVEKLAQLRDAFPVRGQA
jgi:hypothetical protein